MNAYAKKIMTYHTVHQLQRDGLSISQIGKELVLNWRIVKKYLSMTESDYEQFLLNQSERKKDLEPCEGFVKARLTKYLEASAAQMHDWIKEHYPDFPAFTPKMCSILFAGFVKNIICKRRLCSVIMQCLLRAPILRNVIYPDL